MPTSIVHTIRGDRASYSRSAQVATFMVSLRAQEFTPAERKPVDLVLVIDKSGSMGSEGKMGLTIETAELVAKELGNNDRLSIVTFDAAVNCPLPLTKMDKAGRAKAAEAIATIRPGSTTNLSGGLLRGIEELAGCEVASETSSVLLLTDGLANNGITDTDGIVKCLEGALTTMPNAPTVFTFGYGADHDEQMLRAVADAGAGVYYFMESGDTVASSFADCLGGLLSVVGQNVRVTIAAAGCDAGAASPFKLMDGQAYKSAAMPGGAVEVTLGDMYSEEEKDLLVEVALPAAAGAGSMELIVSLSYFDIVNAAIVTNHAETSGTIHRTDAEAAVAVEVDAHRNRILAAAAIKQANALARESQDYAGGRAMLARTRATLEASPAAMTPLCSRLMDDLATAEGGLVSRHTYMSGGKYRMESLSQMNSQQRCNTSGASVYKSRRKMEMQAKWVDSREQRAASLPQPVLAAGGGGAAPENVVKWRKTATSTPLMATPGSDGKVAKPASQTGIMHGMATFFGCASNEQLQ